MTHMRNADKHNDKIVKNNEINGANKLSKFNIVLPTTIKHIFNITFFFLNTN